MSYQFRKLLSVNFDVTNIALTHLVHFIFVFNFRWKVAEELTMTKGLLEDAKKQSQPAAPKAPPKKSLWGNQETCNA